MISKNSINQTWITVDLEYDFETDQTRAITEIVPKFLDLFDELGIKATFFVLGEIVEKFPKLIKKISKKHEIASHGYNHVRLDRLSSSELWYQVNESKKIIESLGVKCKGFRAPFFVIHPRLFKMLGKAGYEYDSSLQCSFFPGRYNNLLLSEKKFRLKSYQFGKNVLIEYPVPNWTMLRFPSAGFSYYRLFYPVSYFFKKPYMIYLHPCEFLDKGNVGVKSWVVKKMYRRNQGEKAWKILKNLLRIWKDK